jgi:hypothetical protein
MTHKLYLKKLQSKNRDKIINMINSYSAILSKVKTKDVFNMNPVM